MEVKMKKGERIGAIQGSNQDGSIDFFGYGIYESDEVPTEAVGMLASLIKKAGNVNPKLKLDDGSVVYGCESWWGSEEKIKGELWKSISSVLSMFKFHDRFKIS